MDSADAACVACAHKEELIKEYRAQSAHDADAADRLRQETAAIRGKYLEHQALAARARASSIDSGGRDDAYAEKTAALAAALAAAAVGRRHGVGPRRHAAADARRKHARRRHPAADAPEPDAPVHHARPVQVHPRPEDDTNDQAHYRVGCL